MPERFISIGLGRCPGSAKLSVIENSIGDKKFMYFPKLFYAYEKEKIDEYAEKLKSVLKLLDYPTEEDLNTNWRL
jgi:hypothetical protein